MGIKNKGKKKIGRKLGIVLVVLLMAFGIWKVLRMMSSLPEVKQCSVVESPYSKEDKVLNGVALSYLAYGCEWAEHKEGTVCDLMEANDMRIISKNAGIMREDKDDPKTAYIDSKGYILDCVGDYRFITDLKDESSGFYGVAFGDDNNKTVWVSFSGAVNTSDVVSCAGFVLVPGLSSQERSAFELFNTVISSKEVSELGYGVILTGHSLGGGLATELSLVSGYEAVTINGADGLALDKISGITSNDYTDNHISSYKSNPVKGKYSTMAIVQRLMYCGSYEDMDYHIYPDNGLTDSHSAFSFIGYKDGKAYLPNEIAH